MVACVDQHVQAVAESVVVVADQLESLADRPQEGVPAGGCVLRRRLEVGEERTHDDVERRIVEHEIDHVER